jgi:hypothetical protein
MEVSSQLCVSTVMLLDGRLDGIQCLSTCLKKRNILSLCLKSNSICCYQLSLCNRECFEKLTLYLSGQEISCILRKPFLHYCIYISLLLDPIQSQMNRIYALPLHFIKIHFNISCHLHLGLPSGFFPSSLATKSIHELSPPQ